MSIDSQRNDLIIQDPRTQKLNEVTKASNVSMKVEDLGTNIPKMKPTNIDGLIKAAIEYLESPTITDLFENKLDRKQFLMALGENEKKLYDWLNTNRLSWNSLYGLGNALDLALNIIPKDLEKYSKAKAILQALFDTLPKDAMEYDDLDPYQKLDLSKNIAKSLQRFLTAVEETLTPTSPRE